MNTLLLGTGGWAPTDRRETAAVLVRSGERALLLDAGTGMRRLLTDPALLDGVARLDVVLSHFHLDHVVGLTYLPGLPATVERVVWGPGRALYGTSTAALLGRLASPPLFALELSDFTTDVADLAMGTMELGPFALDLKPQPKHTQPSVAVRVGDELAYCTDTGHDPANSRFARGCRHLLHEAFWTDEAVDDTHSTPAQAAEVALAAGVDRLVLVHLNPTLADDDEVVVPASRIFPAVEAGTDGAVLGPAAALQP